MDQVFRFAGFELDPPRAELRGPGGEAIKLRPKTFEMLRLFANNAGRVVSKRELLDAIWPNVNVGDDSLFQCIRELRAALGDDQRQTIKVASRRGYMLAAEVSMRPFGVADHTDAALLTPRTEAKPPANGAHAAPPAKLQTRSQPTIAVIPFIEASGDSRGAGLAAGVTDRLIDGLARIDAMRVFASRSGSAREPGDAPWPNSDFVVQGELQRGEQSWVLHARLIRTETGEVQSVATVATDINEPDAQLQQMRLAAGVGHPLASRLNTLQISRENHVTIGNSSSDSSARIVIEQALASNNQTTRERFSVAERLLKNAMAADPDNLDLQLALATLQLRGIQMVWYGAAEAASIENNVKSLLERVLRAKPNYIPVLNTYCRFLNTTRQFVENLVACARTLSFDPWNGLALYHLGLAQLHLGRFEDALVTFDQAYRFDTPAASRWTWLLGAGWACMLMDRAGDAVPWLQRSLAVTAASGRTHMLLAAAYQQLGRTGEAKAALAKGLELRPGSTARNVPTPRDNTSPVFVAASERGIRLMVAAGLPEG